MEAAAEYAQQRVQFGHPISAIQAVQHMLANMATELEAARALVYATARTIDAGAKSFTEESAMAKLFASDMAMRVTTDAVQILAGAGYMRDYPVEKMMRDAKITQIYEGTNQVIRNAIAPGSAEAEGQAGMNVVVCIKQVPGEDQDRDRSQDRHSGQRRSGPGHQSS